VLPQKYLIEWIILKYLRGCCIKNNSEFMAKEYASRILAYLEKFGQMAKLYTSQLAACIITRMALLKSLFQELTLKLHV